MKARTTSPWLVWGAGLGVYILVLFHRSSLGVAGPDAQARFGLTAAQLGAFVTVQLTMATVMQIPAGLLADRFGPRKLLIACTLTVGLSQIAFGFVESYPAALAARAVMGGADTLAFVALLRLGVGWFPAKLFPLTTSLSGLAGTIGALVATLPLTASLAEWGWTRTFVVAGAISVLYVVFLLRPAGEAPNAAELVVASEGGGGRVRRDLRDSWHDPVGRMAFWLHWSTMAAPYVFGLLWGYSYLNGGLGYSPTKASSLMALFIIGNLVSNAVLGPVAARWPRRRVAVGVGVSLACVLGWVLLISWPGRPPEAVVAGIIFVFACCAPLASISFMLVRDVTPTARVSTASSLVATAGYGCAIFIAFAVGFVLDLVDGDGPRSEGAYRWAFALLLALTVLGLAQTFRWQRRVRAVGARP